uniref:DNA-3-methyladenine glycosylase II n=1 Tax=uncultured bacterium contig00038 TaxID=1181526 RepID=A0A806KN17_9BACT|nr:DNA-3-methyladenine glycosylase II [uncultured bacterium contig00038]
MATSKAGTKKLSEALKHLRRDASLTPLLDRVGIISFRTNPAPSPLHSLASSITGQQLNGRAAEAIFERFLGLYDGCLTADAILDTPVDTLRSVGLSGAKSVAIRDLAEKTKLGVVPDWPALRRMDDETIIRRLTQVRGIGRWTVEMMLIFCLGRPDVWPVDDFAVRKAFGIHFGIAEPKPADMRTRAEPWRPWRSVVARYLWRSLDMG